MKRTTDARGRDMDDDGAGGDEFRAKASLAGLFLCLVAIPSLGTAIWMAKQVDDSRGAAAMMACEVASLSVRVAALEDAARVAGPSTPAKSVR